MEDYDDYMVNIAGRTQVVANCYW